MTERTDGSEQKITGFQRIQRVAESSRPGSIWSAQRNDAVPMDFQTYLTGSPVERTVEVRRLAPNVVHYVFDADGMSKDPSIVAQINAFIATETQSEAPVVFPEPTPQASPAVFKAEKPQKAKKVDIKENRLRQAQNLAIFDGRKDGVTYKNGVPLYRSKNQTPSGKRRR